MFTPPSNFSQARLWFGCVLSAAITAVAAPWLGADAGVVDQAELLVASGTVTDVANRRYGVEFRIQGEARVFDYPSKARGNGVVLEALRSAGGKTTTVRYHPAPRTPLYSEEKFYTVWELSVDNRVIRSFADSVSGYRSDNSLRPWLAGFFAFATIYFLLLAIKKRRSSPHA